MDIWIRPLSGFGPTMPVGLRYGQVTSNSNGLVTGFGLRIAHVGTARGALDLKGLAADRGPGIAFLTFCDIRITQGYAVDAAQSDGVNDRRVVIADYRADTVSRISDGDVDVAAGRGAADRTADVQVLAVHDHLRPGRG